MKTSSRQWKEKFWRKQGDLWSGDRVKIKRIERTTKIRIRSKRNEKDEDEFGTTKNTKNSCIKSRKKWNISIIHTHTYTYGVRHRLPIFITILFKQRTTIACEYSGYYEWLWALELQNSIAIEMPAKLNHFKFECRTEIVIFRCLLNVQPPFRNVHLDIFMRMKMYTI